MDILDHASPDLGAGSTPERAINGDVSGIAREIYITYERGLHRLGNIDECDAVAVYAHHPGKRVPQSFDVAEPVGGGNRPRRRPASECALAGFAHGAQQRRHVRGVQVRDLVRDVEQIALGTEWHRREDLTRAVTRTGR